MSTTQSPPAKSWISRLWGRKPHPLFLSNVGCQFLTGATALGMARLYGPEPLGTFATFLASTAILGLLFSMYMQHIIPVPEAAGFGRVFFALGLAGLLVGGVVSTLIAIVLEVPFAAYLGVGVLGQGLMVLYQSWWIREGHWQPLALTWLAKALGVGLFQVWAFYRFPNNGLLVGYLLGMAIALGYQIHRCPLFALPPLSILWSAFSESWSLVSRALPAMLMGSLTSYGMPILLFWIFGAETAAMVYLARIVLGKPLQLATGAWGPQFEHRANQYWQAEAYSDLRQLLLRHISTFVLPLLGSWLLLAFLLPWLPFDDQWQRVSWFLWALLPLFVGKAIFSPISCIGAVTRVIHPLLHFSIIELLLLLTFMSLGFHWYNPFWFLVPYSMGMGIGYLMLYVYYYQKVPK